jgi:hypothetical protein
MKDVNRLRLERLTARYADRLDAQRLTPGAEAEFERAFREHAERVIRPVMDEFAEGLRKAGHSPSILVDEAESKPSIELALGLRGSKGSQDRVGFCVLRWVGYPIQLLAYLVVEPPPFDLQRFETAAQLERGMLEQMIMDAIEHIISCKSP